MVSGTCGKPYLSRRVAPKVPKSCDILAFSWPLSAFFTLSVRNSIYSLILRAKAKCMDIPIPSNSIKPRHIGVGGRRQSLDYLVSTLSILSNHVTVYGGPKQPSFRSRPQGTTAPPIDKYQDMRRAK